MTQKERIQAAVGTSDSTTGLRDLVRYRRSVRASSGMFTRRRYASALLVLGASLTLTHLVWRGYRQNLEAEDASRFQAEAEQLSRALSIAFEAPLQAVQALAGLLESLPELEKTGYEHYAERVHLANPALVGVHFLPRIAGSRRDDLLRDYGCALHSPREALVGAAARPTYLPIGRLAAWEDRRLCGMDRLGPGGDNALLAALETNRTVISLLPGDLSAQPTLSIARAVCRSRSALERCELDAVQGLAELWVQIRPLVHDVMRHAAEEGVRVDLFDMSAAQGAHLLYSNARTTPSDELMNDPEAAPRTGYHRHRIDLYLADRWWRVVAVREVRPAFAHAGMAISVGGATISLLLALLVLTFGFLASLGRRLDAALQLGQYSLEEELGRGSMGTVYRARHSLLRRPTALKLLSFERCRPGALQRFEREVQLTALLCHPNTVAIYDFGRSEEGIFYYAMEYLDGIDLQKLVQKFGRLPAGRAVHVLIQVCGALQEAHEHGLIHRDIKPANLMLCVRGGVYDFVKVLDFGLVRDLRDPEVVEGAFVGTPLYAAPEAYTNPETVDQRSDLYSLGAVAFFLLTGREVFRADRIIDVLEQHANAPPRSFATLGVDDVPSSLEQLVMRCLAKAPAQRPPSARALSDELTALAQEATWSARDAAAWWEARAPLARAGGRRAGDPRETDCVSQVALGATLLASAREDALTQP